MDNQHITLAEAIATSQKAGSRTHALDVTNHLVGKYQWETRIAFKANDGSRIATAKVKRTSKYMSADQEKALLKAAKEHAAGNLNDDRIWVYREPVIDGSYWPIRSAKHA